MSSLLRAEGVTYAYGATPALCSADMGIGVGELVAITGASGSGKSTLLHCLAGLLRPSGGIVRYGELRLDELGEARRAVLRRTEFGVLFQFGQLIGELTLAENVALPLLLGGAKRKAGREQAVAWLDRFGVADLADRRASEVSGGQQQRAAVARAMVTNPRILFADEPTGALDALTGEQVLTQIVRVAREYGTAVLLVTHDATVAAYADREIVMRDGQVEPTAELAVQ